MDINNLPVFLFADKRENDGRAKFIVAEINSHSLIAAEANPTAHDMIRKDLEKLLKESGFRGEYKIHGGGKIDFSPERVLAHDFSGSFGCFDKTTAKKILQRAFPDREIEIRGFTRNSGPIVFSVS